MIERDFERARHRSNWNRVLAFFKGKPSLLLPFDLVRSQIDVRSAAYEGIREIEIESVIGSVNRYHEFDREFLPKTAISADRWSNVRKMFDSDVGFPPIKVYQMGEAFFVVDGNHRVSVARQLRIKTIEAEVVHYRTNVPIDKKTNIADLIIKKEYSDFLKQTRLDVLRPQQSIEFTRPGRYATILEHIDKRRYFLGLELGREISYEEAVESWYDSLYRPLLEIFDQDKILKQFPRRTAADLYVWVTNHLYFLRERFGDDVGLATAAKGLRMSKLSGLSSASFARLANLFPSRGKSAETASDAPALRELLRHLQWMERKEIGTDIGYRVPSQWLSDFNGLARVVDSMATRFWRSSIEAILQASATPVIEGGQGEWSRHAVVYNLFVRSSCAFDHDGDGDVSALNRQGIRETGTFLKAITLLPYIQSLGCNVVHLLPICRIGVDGRKGSLGSPYAIANPYQLDETLSEPLVGLGPDAEFEAFVEAAHRLGIRVVVEFVFRTAAKDSEWIHQRPDWFYWIRADVPDRSEAKPGGTGYGSPVFKESDLNALKSQVHDGDLRNLPTPPEEYRAMFVQPPNAGTVTVLGTRCVGTLSDGTVGRIPGAFADWPPDDQQPPWGDVTYLRIYDHPEFNYIAYNTIRMYDERLAKQENAKAELWDRIAGILPYFQNRFGIDGAMIDMGHALPRALMARVVAGARGVDPSFALWEEHFTVRAESKAEGYNASIGNLWWHVHRPEHMKNSVLEKLATLGSPLPFFATPETHNTPRCASRRGGVAQSRFSWIFGAFLPAIPFLHSGFELGEIMPINTGLDFTSDEARCYPEHVLPLFNPYAYDWSGASGLIDVIRLVSAVRHDFEELITDAKPESFDIPKCSLEDGIAYVRQDALRTVLVVGNPSDETIHVALKGIRSADGEWTDRIDGVASRIRPGEISIKLDPWQCLVFTQDRTKR
jgi:Alpha amylase, catalytic domain